MNGTQSDPSNAMAAAVAHGGLLQPMSMQSLLAMTGMGQPTLAAPSNQSISAAAMNNVAAPLCKYIMQLYFVFYLFSLLFYFLLSIH